MPNLGFQVKPGFSTQFIRDLGIRYPGDIWRSSSPSSQYLRCFSPHDTYAASEYGLNLPFAFRAWHVGTRVSDVGSIQVSGLRFRVLGFGYRLGTVDGPPVRGRFRVSEEFKNTGFGIWGSGRDSGTE